jgi:tetraacyldisaccharide 4'-kinase
LAFDDDLPVIITAKDAVKCAKFGLDKIWVLDVTAVLSSDLLSRLAKRVATLKKST